jgi:dTDP-4-dehydrorhamnose 3,5-epimerase
MNLVPTPLPGLTLIETLPSEDVRGRLVRVFCENDLSPLRPGLHFTQVNISTTRRRGTVRGMHYQAAPMAEAKLIRCLRGRVFDVTVDLREGSDTFLQWHAVELDAGDGRQLFVPEGFAHGFQALTDDAELLYLHTRAWSRPHERGLRHDDPMLAIRWPLPVSLVSTKDQSIPLLDAAFKGWSP